MQQKWTDRAIKGSIYLAVGAFFTLSKEQALRVAQGNHLAMAMVLFVFGVIGPILLLAGLYLIGTRNKRPK